MLLTRRLQQSYCLYQLVVISDVLRQQLCRLQERKMSWLQQDGCRLQESSFLCRGLQVSRILWLQQGVSLYSERNNRGRNNNKLHGGELTVLPNNFYAV